MDHDTGVEHNKDAARQTGCDKGQLMNGVWIGRIAWCKACKTVALMALITIAAACNRPGCDGLYAPTLTETAPRLLHGEMLASPPDDPWALIFAFTFADSDGDLADGDLLIFSGSGVPSQMPLQDAFVASELALNATAGRIAVPLNLSQGGAQDDTVMRLGFQVKDAKGQYSNCYSFDIHVDISQASNSSLLPKKVLFAKACGSTQRGPYPFSSASIKEKA